MLWREHGLVDFCENLDDVAHSPNNFYYASNSTLRESNFEPTKIPSNLLTNFTRQLGSFGGYPHLTKRVLFKEAVIKCQNGVVFDSSVLKLSFRRTLEILLISLKLGDISISAAELVRNCRTFRMPYFHPTRYLPLEIETVVAFIRKDCDFRARFQD